MTISAPSRLFLGGLCLGLDHLLHNLRLFDEECANDADQVVSTLMTG